MFLLFLVNITGVTATVLEEKAVWMVAAMQRDVLRNANDTRLNCEWLERILSFCCETWRPRVGFDGALLHLCGSFVRVTDVCQETQQQQDLLSWFFLLISVRLEDISVCFQFLLSFSARFSFILFFKSLYLTSKPQHIHSWLVRCRLFLALIDDLN